MSFFRYYGVCHTFAGGDNETIFDSDDWQKPLTVLWMSIPSFTNEADIDIHATYQGREIWPAVGIEPVVHTMKIPLMLNVKQGTRLHIMGDDGGANTPTLEGTVGVIVNDMVGSNKVFLDGYQGTGAAGNVIDRSFESPAQVRWHTAIEGDMHITIGGFEYSSPTDDAGLIVAGGTQDNNIGQQLGWPMAVGNHFTVDANDAGDYEGLFIYDVQGE